MYKVLDRNALIWVLFVMFGLSFAINFVVYRPDEFRVWMRVVLTTPTTFGFLTFVVGATPLWRWIWRRIPILGRLVFPDLNGTWETQMESNIKVIAKHHPEFAKTNTAKIKSSISGRFSILQNWFRMSIRFDGDDQYSTSNTIVVEPKKDHETGRFTLIYVYRNDTFDPLPSDEQSHFGAAHLEIEPDSKTMRGCYWTNRNASKGLNTAGTIRAQRAC